jgi:hypothetical protein
MKYGGRKQGTPNKLTSSVKEKLGNVLNDCIDSIDLKTLNTSEKIKLIQICSQYIVPKQVQELKSEDYPDTIEVEILKSKG